MVSSSISSEAVLKGTVFDSFKKSVIDKFCIFAGNKAYSYADYLEIPETSHLRHGDEANAVDQQFTLEMLKWLGFDHASWRYNVPKPGTGSKLNRPDYEVRGSIGVAFIVEDKSSVTNFDADQHLKQMQRYCVGTAGYAIWCNMRRIIAIRFLPDNAIKYEILVDISIEKLFGSQQLPPTEKEMQEKEMQIDNLALFQLLFSKERFTNFDLLLTKICVDEQTFKERAIHLDTPQAIKNFIEGSRQSLSHLKLAALSQIQKSLAFRRNMNKEQNTLFHEWNEEKTNLANRINYSIISDPVVKEIDQLTPHLGSLKPYEIGRVREVIQEICKKASVKLATIMPLYEIWEERALRINSALLSQRFDVTEILRTAEAFNVWSERQSDKEDIKSEIFAEQVAYVFFVRLLLIRVLEDKNILHPRLASDGGFLDWSNYVAQHFEELKGIGILNETFCSILSRKASAYYLHFFQQAVFDWFTPDDFLLVETLEFLCQYNLSDITSDIVGFTYEAYIDRNARDRKGHFLTRQDVVEYMLDVLGYVEPEIRTERRILDPACGSGSFLVHAARRYRRALITEFCNINGLPDKEESIKLDSALRKEFARQYVDHLMTSFFGMELNPFACYLAEMNLLIQALDDLFVLQQAGDAQPIERFQIYNTNSLDLPREILDRVDLSGDANRISMPDRLSERLADEAYPIKAGLAKYAEGFFYIISNPPYVSSKQEFKEAKQYRNTDFYTSILSGDANL